MEVFEIAKSRIECLFNRVEQLTYDLAPQLENFPKKERTLFKIPNGLEFTLPEIKKDMEAL